MNLVVILVYFLVVILPVVFWIWFFRRLDRLEPEPKKVVFKAFKLGFVAMILAVIVEFLLEREYVPVDLENLEFGAGSLYSHPALFLVMLSFFLAGPIEELMKYIVLKRSIYLDSNFNQIADGVVYGTALSLGFAFIENSAYFLDVYNSFSTKEFLFITIIRGMATTALHVVSAGIMGLYLGKAKFMKKNRRVFIFKGILFASLIHGCYNLFIFFPFGMTINFFLIFSSMSYLIYEFKKEETQLIWEFSERVINKGEVRGVAKIMSD